MQVNPKRGRAVSGSPEGYLLPLFVPVINTVRVRGAKAQLRRTLLWTHKSEEIPSYGSHCHSNSHTSCNRFVTRTTERRVHFYGLYYICVMWRGYSGRGSHNSEFSDSYDFQVSVKWLLFFPWFFLLSGWICFSLYLGFSELFWKILCFIRDWSFTSVRKWFIKCLLWEEELQDRQRQLNCFCVLDFHHDTERVGREGFLITLLTAQRARKGKGSKLRLTITLYCTATC